MKNILRLTFTDRTTVDIDEENNEEFDNYVQIITQDEWIVGENFGYRTSDIVGFMHLDEDVEVGLATFNESEQMAIDSMTKLFEEWCYNCNDKKVYHSSKGTVDVEKLVKKLKEKLL